MGTDLIDGKAHNIAYIKKLNTSYTALILEPHRELLHTIINPVRMKIDMPISSVDTFLFLFRILFV
jgi:hypothetical protein